MLHTTTSRREAELELSATIAERVDLALADPATQAALAARGISLEQARRFLIARTESELDR